MNLALFLAVTYIQEIESYPMRAAVAPADEVTVDQSSDRDSFRSRIDLAFLEQLLDAAPVVLFTTNAAGQITLSRGSALPALGLAQDALVGKSVFSLYTDEPKIAHAATAALNGETVVAELVLDGIVHNTQFAPLSAADGTVEGIVGVATDITAQVEAQRALEHLAHFDALTGLPNRSSLRDYVQKAIATVPTTPCAVAIIGLDQFRDVNHTFGYEVGDLAIKEIANRIDAEFQGSEHEYCARAAADEFAVVVSEIGRAHV